MTVFACAAFAGPLDHFIVNLNFSSTTTGVADSATVEAYDSMGLKTDYTGPAYLSVIGGGEVIVVATGTSATAAFTGGAWNGIIKILRAGNVTVEARDGAATGTSGAINMLAGPYQKLKMVANDMIFTPGTITGHAGTLAMHTTQSDFGVTVYAVDEWNNPVVPPSATGIRLMKGFSSGYISVTPYCDILNTHDLFGAGASSITFTVAVWPNPNETKPYTIIAKDDSRGFENPLQIDFFSLTDYYFKTTSPLNVTAGVPFGVTVQVSHFPPVALTPFVPDSTYTEAVRLKAINSSDAADAVPVLTNSQLTPQPTPFVAACVSGAAYFNVAYTRAGSICMMPIPAGVKPVVNYLDPTSYLPCVSVGAAAPYSMSFTAAADRLQRNLSTQLTVRPLDIFGNPVTGTAVAIDIIGGTKNGYLGGNPSASHADISTNGFGIASISFTAPSGNYENIIYATVAPIAVSQSVKILSELTDKFENWPNPFIAGKESTKINYSLPEDSAVSMKLFSSFGKLVWTKEIAKGEVVAGENHGKKGGNTVIWNGTGDKGFVVGAGVYILKMTVKNTAGTTVMTRKIAVTK